jgi:hypothetical protein
MTDKMTETSNIPVAEPDTYHDQKALIMLAEIADRIAWLFLFLFLVVGGVILYLVWLTIKSRIGVEQFFLNLPTYLTPFFIGGFIWIALKLVSEAVYLLMDIEDNTRRSQLPTQE